MNKLINSSSIVKNIIFLILSSFLTIISLIMFIKSYEMYDDGFGTDYSFNMDYAIYFIVSIILLVYSISLFKSNNNIINSTHLSFGMISVIICFYYFGVFFKGIFKDKPFIEISDYLYIGITFLLLLGYIIFSYLNTKQEKDH